MSPLTIALIVLAVLMLLLAIALGRVFFSDMMKEPEQKSFNPKKKTLFQGKKKKK